MSLVVDPAQLRQLMPRRPYVPTVLDVAGAATCPRISLLKLIYGASGEYNAGLAIGAVTHSVLAELGRIESRVVKEVNPTSTLDEIRHQIYKIWVEAAESKINDSWRIFADAQISAQEGRRAVLENLRGFSNHLAKEIQEGYQKPDQIITGHHIINLDLPLEGVPDEYRIFHNPLRIEIREFKSYGGAKVNETSKLQACGYQLLLETLYPNADFKLKVYARDDDVNVRMTDKRRQHLIEGIQTITEVYEHARGRAKPIPQLCSVCGVNQACQYYFNDSQPPNIRRYLWRLRMETLEEKGQNQSWKWKSKLLPIETRAELGITDGGYRVSELTSRRVRLVKDGRPNVLPGDTVIVSGGNPLTTPNFTGEVAELEEDSVTIVPYGDLPMGLPDHDLTIDHYDVDLTRRQLRSVDAVHRAQGRSGELTRRILGIEPPRTATEVVQVQFTGKLNAIQQDAVRVALSAPDYAVILGPPGTGKTTVIVELLVQLALAGKRSLAVSITNTAVDNIVERLLDQGHRFEIRFGNWFKIRERVMQVALINLLTGKEDLALAAVDRMRTAAAVLTTCSSASLDLVRAGHFDVILFEESSQIRMQDAFAALTQGEKIVIIGDDKQLSPVSQLNKPISSLLDISMGTLTRHGLQSTLIRDLRLQYRMREEICSLINGTFYNGRLDSSPEIRNRPSLYSKIGPVEPTQLTRILDPSTVIGVIDVEGVEEYRAMTTYNLANLHVDLRLLQALQSAGLALDQIGIITPYKEQQRLLAKAIGRTDCIGTVDSYQGQERDLIILDLVRANPRREVGFTLQPNRLNVALSRAREKLIILTNMQTYQGHEKFDEILQRIQSLPNTRVEHVTADELGINLRTYRKREEIQIIPDLSNVTEPDEQPPVPIAKSGSYFDVY
ncbi:MAG TPA: AAA domain-containing protein [Candidatus Acidoferrum sp.]|nr:AAA domain-containing protein [Candidatus Acidoferrum sp.]